MTLFQLLMLGASAFFAYKVYEHIQTLQDPKEKEKEEFHSPVDASALVEKGDEEMEKGALQRALAIYSEANLKAPKNSETLFKMGYVLASQDRDDEALEYYEEALSLDAKSSAILQALASLHRKMGNYAEAQRYLDRVLELDDKNPITYYNYGNLLVDMNETERAKEMYRKAIALEGDFKEAKEELEKLS